jgi:hypothetical protein
MFDILSTESTKGISDVVMRNPMRFNHYLNRSHPICGIKLLQENMKKRKLVPYNAQWDFFKE